MGFGPDSWRTVVRADTISAPVADRQVSTPLEKFAAERRLSYAAGANLPSEGTTLGKSGKVEGAASGKLPQRGQGDHGPLLLHETHTDADDHTHTTTCRLTIVVSFRRRCLSGSRAARTTSASNSPTASSASGATAI
jgi:hypothetical protein